MAMKRITILIILILALGVSLLYSQDTTPVGEADADRIGVDSAQQMIESVTVTTFEDAGFWKATIALDQGIIIIRTRTGNPQEKETIDAERLEKEVKIQESTMEDVLGKYVLGTKVIFYKRSSNAFTIEPVKPLPIPGITKTISVWVVGRNYNHVLKIMVADYFGKRMELTLGKLNFPGWKRLTVAIPPSILQTDYHFTTKEGIKFLGFKIECDIDEAFGTYYIYFDDLSAKTDLFSEISRDVDDIADGW